MTGFDDYWPAGGLIFAAKRGMVVEIDLELATMLHTMHLREARRHALAGEIRAHDHHHECERMLAQTIAKVCERRRTLEEIA